MLTTIAISLAVKCILKVKMKMVVLVVLVNRKSRIL